MRQFFRSLLNKQLRFCVHVLRGSVVRLDETFFFRLCSIDPPVPKRHRFRCVWWSSSILKSHSASTKFTLSHLLSARTMVQDWCQSRLRDPVCRHRGSCLRGAAPMFRGGVGRQRRWLQRKRGAFVFWILFFEIIYKQQTSDVLKQS